MGPRHEVQSYLDQADPDPHADAHSMAGAVPPSPLWRGRPFRRAAAAAASQSGDMVID
ncbi:MAG TPA: hypothetical protein VGG38_21165 [Acidimicrobiales bacterium]|jgi:hypothetical protein